MVWMGSRPMIRRPSVEILISAVGLIGVLVGALVLSPLIRSAARGRARTVTPPQVETIRRPSSEEVSRPHVEKAEAKTQEAIEPCLELADQFSGEAKKNSRAMAEAMLGWKATYALVRDKIDGGQRLKEHINQTFQRYAFSPQSLEKLAIAICENVQADLKSIENQMLVDLREDLSDLPGSTWRPELDSEDWTRAFQQLVAPLVAPVETELEAGALRRLTSVAISEALTAVPTRAAVSAGILGTGAASGAALLGIGLAAGVVVDQIVGAIYDALYNPEGELAKQSDERIEEVHRAFRSQLQQLLEQEAQQRNQHRREALLRMLDSLL